MANLKDIRRRVASVKNTQKITRAMKMVSAAKLRRAQQAMVELRPYADKHRELLESVVGQLGSDEAAHPLLETRSEVKKIAIFALSSDRGMCGGFNAQVQKFVARLSAENADKGIEVTVAPLGRRINAYASKTQSVDVLEAFGEIIPATSTEMVRKITDRLVDGFLAGDFDAVYLVYNTFQSVIAQEVVAQQLLPVVAEGGDVDELAGDLIYEPDQQSILKYIAPRYVEVQVRSAILESIAGEHAARMTAMNAATDNATDMISALTLQVNRARQAAITKELMEIIGGAEALK